MNNINITIPLQALPGHPPPPPSHHPSPSRRAVSFEGVVVEGAATAAAASAADSAAAAARRAAFRLRRPAKVRYLEEGTVVLDMQLAERYGGSLTIHSSSRH